MILKELNRLSLDKELLSLCLENINKFECTFDLIDYCEYQIELNNMECPF